MNAFTTHAVSAQVSTLDELAAETASGLYELGQAMLTVEVNMAECQGATPGQKSWLGKAERKLEGMRRQERFLERRLEGIILQRAWYERKARRVAVAPTATEVPSLVPLFIGTENNGRHGRPHKHPRRYVAKGERKPAPKQKARKPAKGQKGKKQQRGGKRLVQAA